MKKLTKLIQVHFDKNMAPFNLFRVNVTGQAIWGLYLKSFTDEDNPVFRDPESSDKNCNHCSNFIRRYGNVVAINNEYQVVTLFDFDIEGEYSNSIQAIGKLIRGKKVVNPFVETFSMLNSLPYESVKKTNEVFRLGVEKNHKKYSKAEAEMYGVVKEGEIRRFDHFYLDLPKRFVDFSGKSPESITGTIRDAKNVFLRGMKEIGVDTLQLVIDLINQKSILNATPHLDKLQAMISLTEEYNQVQPGLRDNWAWVRSYGLNIAKFRNELIGTLCVEIAQGMDLNKACLNWNKRVDPVNYKKASAPITEAQKNRDRKLVEELGCLTSFDRRPATIEDVKANEILHLNEDHKPVSIFDSVPTKKGPRSRSTFDSLTEVSIQDFMSNILPSASEVEVFLENKHIPNLCTMFTSKEDTMPIFNYSNNFSMTTIDNLASKSEIKEAVLSQGGKDGVLRFSIMWSEGDGDDSDLDAHCVEPGGFEIYYGDKLSPETKGELDIDIREPLYHQRNGKKVVENIVYVNLSDMVDGDYKFYVNQFAAHNSKGFKAEVQTPDEFCQYKYSGPVKGKNLVCTVTLRNGKFTIKHKLPHTEVNTTVYNLETNKFHKVNLLCKSPNHWEKPIGLLSYLFFLENCKADKELRTYHTVDLIPELHQARKTLDYLGHQVMVKPEGKQLSGLSFNSTVSDSLIVKVKGTHQRTIKIKF